MNGEDSFVDSIIGPSVIEALAPSDALSIQRVGEWETDLWYALGEQRAAERSGFVAEPLPAGDFLSTLSSLMGRAVTAAGGVVTSAIRGTVPAPQTTTTKQLGTAGGLSLPVLAIGAILLLVVFGKGWK